MPVAVVTLEPVRRELKSLPGAWIDIVPMAYGKKMRRADNISQTTMKTGGDNGKDVEADIKTLQREAAAYDFKTCIVDHNLQEADGETLLDFKDDGALDRLDGRVGEEIGNLIDELNNFDPDAEEN